MISEVMVFDIYIRRPSAKFEPRLFKPRSRKPEKMLSEFVAEARRIITEFEKIKLRHHDIIIKKEPNHRISKEKFIFVIFKMMLSGSEPERFSYDYHSLRKEIMECEDSNISVNTFDIFLRIGKICGAQPLWNSIWSANRTLDIMYRPPNSPYDEPQFDDSVFFLGMKCVSALKLYVEIADRFGESVLLGVVNGAELEISYSLDSNRHE